MEAREVVNTLLARLTLNRALADVADALKGAKLYLAGASVTLMLQEHDPDRIQLLVAGPERTVNDMLSYIVTDKIYSGASAAMLNTDDSGRVYVEITRTGRVEIIEVTSLERQRKERASGNGRASSTPLIDGHLATRQFTFEAVAVELRSRTLLDPSGGLDDIMGRRLRIHSESAVAGVPTWPLRALVVLGQTGMVADASLVERMQADADGLADVNIADVRAVLSAVVASDHMEAAMKVAFDTGVLRHLLPDLAGRQATLEGSALDELALVASGTRDPAMRMATLIRPSGAEGARRDLVRVGLPEAFILHVCDLIDQDE